MADPFVAEVRIFPFNFPPTGWAFCDGQLMPISQNTALFSLLGTVYGGDGKSTFALPNLQGSTVMQPGQGQGLSLRDLGEIGGAQNVTLLQTEMPAHNHMMSVEGFESAENQFPENGMLGVTPQPIYKNNAPVNSVSGLGLTPTGGGLPHNNMMPYLTLSFCIAMQGIFPARP